MKKNSLLGIYLTNQCNLQCNYCYLREEHELKKKFLSIEEFKRIREQFTNYEIQILGLTGGEPTIQWNSFMEILKDAKEFNSEYLTVSTNGLLLNESRLKEIKELDIPNFGLLVSLDSLKNEEIHNSMRGNNHSKVLKIIKLIEKYEINYSISMVVHRNNFDELQDFLKYCENLKSRRDWAIPPLILSQMIVSGGGKDLLKMRLRNKQEKALDEIIQKYWGNLTFDCCFAPFLQEKPEKFSDLAGCPGGKTEFCIDPNGNLFPCIEISSIDPIGNVFENDFETILESSEVIKKIRNNEIGEPCKSCSNLTCQGGCRIMGKIFYDDFFAGLTFCKK